MSNPEDKTAAQTLFLRAFRESSAGPPPQDWPAPGTFRRWLKKESFRKALASIRDALRFQADLHVATAAAQAAKNLQAALPTASPLDLDAAAQLTTQLKAITDLLRLAHLRQRFPADAPSADESSGHCINQPGYGEIVHNPDRLKSLLLLFANDSPEYDQFLAAFPEELDDIRRHRASVASSP
jgi:hypothetical protein